MKSLGTDDLIIFVPLAGNQDQIVSASLPDGVMNCLAAIRNLVVRLAGFLNALFSVGKNLIRIFGARIIGSKNYYVAQRARSFAHRRPLRAIAITAAAKHRDDSSFCYLARGSKYIQKRIVAVRVVNNHSEISVMRHAFKSPRCARTFL